MVLVRMTPLLVPSIVGLKFYSGVQFVLAIDVKTRCGTSDRLYHCDHHNGQHTTGDIESEIHADNWLR